MDKLDKAVDGHNEFARKADPLRERIAALEAALREIERADYWMMTGDAALKRAVAIARNAVNN